MPEFIDGLPLHALVVHFVVVLLPIAVLGAILTAVWPAVRRRFGWLAVAAAGVGAALTPVATSSGTNLADRVGTNPQVEKHMELGEQLIWWSLPLFLLVGALMVLHTMAERKATVKVAVGAAGAEHEEAPAPAGKGPALALIVAAVLTVGVAVGTGIHVYRVGDAGARAVWGDVQNLPPAGNGG